MAAPNYFPLLCLTFAGLWGQLEAVMEAYGLDAGDTIMPPGEQFVKGVEVLKSPTTQKFPFFGRSYPEIYIGANGVISFGERPNTFMKTQTFPQKDPLLCAVWLDVLETNHLLTNKIYYRQSLDRDSLLNKAITQQIRDYRPRFKAYHAEWVMVLSFEKSKWLTEDDNMLTKSGEAPSLVVGENVYQIVLTTNQKRSFAIFNYRKMDWIENSPDNFANAGFNAGDGYYKEIEGARTALFSEVTNKSNVNFPGRWIYQVDRSKIPNDVQDTCKHSENIISSVTPAFGTIMGGTEVDVEGICFDKTTSASELKIICKFGKTEIVGQKLPKDNGVRCISPPLAGDKEVTLQISVDGGLTFPYNSKYRYDRFNFPVQLVNRGSWSRFNGPDNILVDHLKWDSKAIDHRGRNVKSTVHVDVDFFGWFLDGPEIENNVRLIALPLAKKVKNTGKLTLTLQPIDFQRNGQFVFSNSVFLKGFFRITAARDRELDRRNNPKENATAMLWSGPTSMDIFTRLNGDVTKPSFLASSAPDLETQRGDVVHYTNNRMISPLFGQAALSAMNVVGLIEPILPFQDWSTLYRNDLQRHEFIKSTLNCRLYSGAEGFCDCWSGSEGKMFPYNPDDCAVFPPCPATADRARLDRGRFDVESPKTSSAACNKVPTVRLAGNIRLFGPCDDHDGAILCVNSISTVGRGFKQQCCYGQSGQLLHVNDSPGAGRVRRAIPEDLMPRQIEGGLLWLAKEMEYFIMNGLPYETCCPKAKSQNTANCQTYRKARKAGTGSCYVKPQPIPEPPPPPPAPSRPASSSGDPHIQTYDGFKYTFNGLGEYVILQMTDVFTFQGRTTKVAVDPKEDVVSQATVWSGLVFRVGNTTVQISASKTGLGLDIHLNYKLLEPEEYEDIIESPDTVLYLVVENEILKKVSARLQLGVLLDMQDDNAVIQFELSLPPQFKGDSMRGLLGSWNDQQADDLIPRNAAVSLPLDSTTETIFYNFGESWRVTEAETLFVYEKPDTYASINDRGFVPLFEPPEMEDWLQVEADRVCKGNKECLYDIATTQVLAIGESTLLFEETAEGNFNVSTSKIVSCGYPKLENQWVRKLIGDSYLSPEKVTLGCDREKSRYVAGDHGLICGDDGRWIGQPLQCVGYCGQPSTTSQFVQTDGTSFSTGDTVEFTCTGKSVYRSGNLSSTCMENAEWSGIPLECIPYCGKPEVDSATVIVIGESFDFGDIVEFRCTSDSVYRSGSSSSVCDGEGNWSGQLIECEQRSTTTETTTISTETASTKTSATFAQETSTTGEAVSAESSQTSMFTDTAIHWEERTKELGALASGSLRLWNFAGDYCFQGELTGLASGSAIVYNYPFITACSSMLHFFEINESTNLTEQYWNLLNEGNIKRGRACVDLENCSDCETSKTCTCRLAISRCGQYENMLWDYDETTHLIKARAIGKCMKASLANKSVALAECETGDVMQQWAFV